MNDVLFRELVEEVVNGTTFDEVDSLEALYSRYGLQSADGSYRRDKVADHVRAQIMPALDREKGSDLRDLGNLQRQLILEHLLNGTPLRPSLDILEVIFEELRFGTDSAAQYGRKIEPLKRS